MPQLAHKADNELFIAAIHLDTSHGNCFSLWFSLWLCIPPGYPPSKLNKETVGPVITADEWVCTQLIFQWGGTAARKGGGFLFASGNQAKNPTSCQWPSDSTLKCTAVSPSARGLVKYRTAWMRLKVDDRALEGINFCWPRLYWITVKDVSIWYFNMQYHAYGTKVWENSCEMCR